MKKLLIGLLVLGSISAFAGDYRAQSLRIELIQTSSDGSERLVKIKSTIRWDNYGQFFCQIESKTTQKNYPCVLRQRVDSEELMPGGLIVTKETLSALLSDHGVSTKIATKAIDYELGTTYLGGSKLVLAFWSNGYGSFDNTELNLGHDLILKSKTAVWYKVR